MSNQFSGYLLVSCYSLLLKQHRFTTRKCNVSKNVALFQTPSLPLHQVISMPNTNIAINFYFRYVHAHANADTSPHLPPNNPSLPHRADGVVAPPQQFLQSGLRRIFLRRVHVLPIVPVASRDRQPGDGDVAGPGGTLASTVREDLVLWR